MNDQHERIDPLIELTGEIVGAYLGNNPVAPGAVTALIGEVHATLSKLRDPGREADAAPRPAVAVGESVTDEFIVCLEDGKRFKSLKRHLMSRYGMTPDEYRAKWNLPGDYPMVARNYAEKRSRLAKNMGLGRRREEGDRVAA